MQNTNLQEDNEIMLVLQQVVRNYKLFIISIVISLGIAVFLNQTSLSYYKVSSSLLIKENKEAGSRINMTDILSSSLLGSNQNFENELWVLKSYPVVERTVRNLSLEVDYLRKEKFQYVDIYKSAPFRILFLRNHVQPIGARFEISFKGNGNFAIKAESKKISLYNYEENAVKSQKEKWAFNQNGKFGQLIENDDLSFIVALDSTKKFILKENLTYYFEFKYVPGLTNVLEKTLEFDRVDKNSTVVEISLKSQSIEKGLDILNELMDVYSRQNLDRKNHEASVTIDYIDKQLGEISDSLKETEKNMQYFRSSNQLLNVADQSSGLISQYRQLQNEQAELISKKRYYDYVADYLAKNEDFSNIIIPANIGISDQLLNNLMAELVSAQAQRSNLIENKQDKSPLIKKLEIQMENLKRTITENISYVRKTAEISIDEMNKRISKIEGEINRLPGTERQLGGIERKYQLNNSIYNYLLEKRAEAKIAKASNLPDNVVVEPAKLDSLVPVSPNKKANYFIFSFLGLIFPLGLILLKNFVNNKIESQDNIESLTDIPVLGKIIHNTKKTNNVVFEHPNSSIAESYRVLRTNLEYYLRGKQKKVMLVTSCVEKEGKSFNALNIAMCYAQLNRRTILLDYDLRKTSSYFNKQGESLIGLSSYLIDKANIEDIIVKSPHDKLDYIPSGPLPPNPVELLALEKNEKLIARLKEKYDYIIIDTPPLAQVTDAYQLIDLSDVRVLVTRYNFSLKKVFSLIVKDLHLKNIGNVCIVFNDNRAFHQQYGYGYGYHNKKS